MEQVHIEWTIISLTCVACMAMHIFSVNKDFRGAQDWISKAFPTLGAQWVHRVDCLLVVFLGTIIALVAFEPKTEFQAVAAGMGWVSILNTLGHKGPAIVNDGDLG